MAEIAKVITIIGSSPRGIRESKIVDTGMRTRRASDGTKKDAWPPDHR